MVGLQATLSAALGSPAAAGACRVARRLAAGLPLFRLLAILLVAAIYFASARLGLHFGTVGGIAAPVWPPPGICLAALVLLGYRVWPGVALGALATNASIGVPLLGALALAASNSAAALAGAWLLRRLRFSASMSRLRDVFALVALAAIVSTIGATAAAIIMSGRGAHFGAIWRTWWAGDAMSILLLTPLVCTWAVAPVTRPARQRTLEAIVLVGIQPLVNALVFFGVLDLTPLGYVYVLYPMLIWTAVRFGQRATTASLVLTTAIAIGATASGHGPFAGHTATRNLMALHTFIAVAAVSFLMLAASTEELRTALARVAAGLEAIVRSSSDAIVSATLSGTITSWNAAAERLYGYTAAEAIGRPISLILPPSHLDEMRDIFGRISRGERIHNRDTVRRTRDGSEIAVSVTLSPIADEAGQVLGVSCIARDIRERRRADQERERLLAERELAVHLRDDFLSVASHELRTPVTALSLKLERLAHDATPEQRRQTIDGALRIMRRLGRMIDDLLDVTRVRAGRLRLDPSDVDLTRLVQEVVLRMRDQAARAGSTIALRAAGPVNGRWDRARLDQVVENLLTNAVKYGRGRPIEVTVEATTQAARLVVRDEGIGIAPQDRARIFERFGRAASSRSYGGLGLGLWIAAQIVEASGGRIAVESLLGRGATFTVELPRDAP